LQIGSIFYYKVIRFDQMNLAFRHSRVENGMEKPIMYVTMNGMLTSNVISKRPRHKEVKN